MSIEPHITFWIFSDLVIAISEDLFEGGVSTEYWRWNRGASS